jgi:hypothetical protein
MGCDQLGSDQPHASMGLKSESGGGGVTARVPRTGCEPATAAAAHDSTMPPAHLPTNVQQQKYTHTHVRKHAVCALANLQHTHTAQLPGPPAYTYAVSDICQHAQNTRRAIVYAAGRAVCGRGRTDTTTAPPTRSAEPACLSATSRGNCGWGQNMTPTILHTVSVSPALSCNTHAHTNTRTRSARTGSMHHPRQQWTRPLQGTAGHTTCTTLACARTHTLTSTHCRQTIAQPPAACACMHAASHTASDSASRSPFAKARGQAQGTTRPAAAGTDNGACLQMHLHPSR